MTTFHRIKGNKGVAFYQSTLPATHTVTAPVVLPMAADGGVFVAVLFYTVWLTARFIRYGRWPGFFRARSARTADNSKLLRCGIT